VECKSQPLTTMYPIRCMYK